VRQKLVKSVRLGAQALAATRAAGSENLAATDSGEAGAEAVAALADQFAGLICALHGSFSADRAFRKQQTPSGI
jgi:hypothetical protein